MAVGPKKDMGFAAHPSSASGECTFEPPDSLQPERVVTVLALSPLEQDHLLLRAIFSHTRWQIHSVRSWAEAKVFLAEHPMPVVIAERELGDATWRDVLAGFAEFDDPPALIVTSRQADEYLWAEVLNLGGYDVLMKPFDATEVYRVISLAWLNWKNGCERTRAARASLATAAIAG
jgi:DNA-binding response OmpR family regulator